MRERLCTCRLFCFYIVFGVFPAIALKADEQSSRSNLAYRNNADRIKEMNE